MGNSLTKDSEIVRPPALVIITPLAFITTGIVFFRMADYVQHHAPGLLSGFGEYIAGWFFSCYGALLSPVIILLLLPSVKALFVKAETAKAAQRLYFRWVRARNKWLIFYLI